jgi:hypothetical protein
MSQHSVYFPVTKLAAIAAIAIFYAPWCTQVQAQVAAASAPASVAAPATAPRSILWVGNSFFYYNNSLHNHYGRLVRAAGGTARGVSSTISGSGIDWHDIDSLLRPNGLGRYSFVGDNDIRFNSPGRQFDAAIMMDCSQCPIHPQLGAVFHDTVKKHSDKLRAAGVQPLLFMSWAYKDKPDMTQSLAEQYTKAGAANSAKVIPVGLAFARSVAARPELELYADDKRHPSLAGSYLAACTVYASLHVKSPEGLAYAAELDAATARFLQGVAWEAVQAYK